MPIFEYHCSKCEKDFELIVNASTRIACPDCGSKKVEKLLSTFAAHAGGADNLPPCHRDGPGCDMGKCGSGRCGLE